MSHALLYRQRLITIRVIHRPQPHDARSQQFEQRLYRFASKLAFKVEFRKYKIELSFKIPQN